LAKLSKKSSIIITLIKIFSILIVLFLILAAAAIGTLMYFNAPAKDDKPIILTENDAIRLDEDGTYLIDIRRGETSQSVGLRLERTGIIKNRYFWNLYCRYKKEHIKAGTYRLELPATQMEIHNLLVNGREILHRITIPEGVTIRRAALIFEEMGFCTAEDFLTAANDPEIISFYGIPNDSMEGYLFPDTYLFPGGYSANQIVRKMADTFFAKIESIDPDFAGMDMKELNEKVILASIVEREYRVAEEAPVMAGVFYNRIRIRMALQSCATVEYIITEIQGKPHPNVLLYRDLEIRNPYNTYIYPGLPPGPISAPGIVSLNAVMNPAETNFLYFRLTDPASGRHYFSRTHDEHIRAGQLITKPTWP